MNIKNTVPAEHPKKKILISFLTFDKDNFDFKKEDVLFRKQHGMSICGEAKAIPPSQLKRDQLWRPAVAMVRYGELPGDKQLHFDEYHLIYSSKHESDCPWFTDLKNDIQKFSPDTLFKPIRQTFKDPYNFKSVYTFLYKLSKDPKFHQSDCEYYVNCTSGTYVMRSCLFVLTQEGLFPGVRIEPRPWIDEDHRDQFSAIGSYQIDDPEEINRTRCNLETGEEKVQRNKLMLAPSVTPEFLELQERIAKTVSAKPNGRDHMIDPILFTGVTGSGKTTIVENIAEKIWGIDKKKFIRVNCAELRGDPNIAKIALFGCKRGAHSYATADRKGKFDEAHGGLLFLDEIGELAPEVQAMLLTAIERRPGCKGYTITPLGGLKSDEHVCEFHLICGTNRDLYSDPNFRQDLLARISTWHFELPSLAERRKDIPAQKTYALEQFKNDYGALRTFSAEAAERFEEFAKTWPWKRNFREFNDMIRRMATLNDQGNLISLETVEAEIKAMERDAAAHVPPPATSNS